MKSLFSVHCEEIAGRTPTKVGARGEHGMASALLPDTSTGPILHVDVDTFFLAVHAREAGDARGVIAA